jgi:hypothetical protein
LRRRRLPSHPPLCHDVRAEKVQRRAVLGALFMPHLPGIIIFMFIIIICHLLSATLPLFRITLILILFDARSPEMPPDACYSFRFDVHAPAR